MNKDLWPLRVGVRYFRPPCRPQQDRNTWTDQSSPSGGRPVLEPYRRKDYAQQQNKKTDSNNRTTETKPQTHRENKR